VTLRLPCVSPLSLPRRLGVPQAPQRVVCAGPAGRSHPPRQ